MYFICKECGKIVDDGCFSDKICANCILYSVDESRSENEQGQNAQEINENDLNEYIRNNPEKWEYENLEFYLGSLSDEELSCATSDIERYYYLDEKLRNEGIIY